MIHNGPSKQKSHKFSFPYMAWQVWEVENVFLAIPKAISGNILSVTILSHNLMLPFSGSIFFAFFLRGSLAPNVLKSGVLREVFTNLFSGRSEHFECVCLDVPIWILYGTYLANWDMIPGYRYQW